MFWNNCMIVLVKSSFWFRFRLFIQPLALWSIDEKAEAEPKVALGEYYQSVYIVRITSTIGGEVHNIHRNRK